MLKKMGNSTLGCSVCGGTWVMVPGGLSVADPCPCDDCKSNATTPIGIITRVMKAQSKAHQGSLVAAAAESAVTVLKNEWKAKHGNDFDVLVMMQDLNELQAMLGDIKSEIIGELAK